MKVKLILPAVTDPKSPYFRPIKYSLFPPLGLATLAAYLREEDEVTLQDEHVEPLDLDDQPDLVAIQVYITSARRAYRIADHYRSRGVHVALGGVHVTSLPEEASQHADTIFLGPGEDTWPTFLSDFRAGRPGRIYQSTVRSLIGQPPIRRDLIKRNLYLLPNSLSVSRGCPHACDFCYKTSFFLGGKSYYTQAVDQALAEIERLPGRHLYFVDDHLFGNREFALALFEGMRGMGRIWQACATVQSVMEPDLLESAVESGLRSLFIGFETLSPANLEEQHKHHNLHRPAATAESAAADSLDYAAAVRRVHEAGVMINASFVFGMDDDDETVFERTVEWAIRQGLETATFHILTPYPGTPLHTRLKAAGRITTEDWDLYDARHVVFRPARMSAARLEAGYWQAYRDFYRWSSILRSAATKPTLREQVRHLAYAGGWKKCEPLWDLVIRAKRVCNFDPLLEAILCGFGQFQPGTGRRAPAQGFRTAVHSIRQNTAGRAASALPMGG